MNKIQLIMVSGLLSLTACGGGGGDDSDTSTPPVTPPPTPEPDNTLQACAGNQTNLVSQSTNTDITFWLEPSYSAAQPVSIIARLPNSQNAKFQWQQIAGPDVELVSGVSPVLGMELPLSASYEFELTVSRNGQNQSANITINAEAQKPEALNIRLDHQVTEGDNISLRLDDTGANDTASWCQASGPAIEVDLSNPDKPLMIAPQVNEDTLVHIKATKGAQSDDVYLLITNEPNIDSEALFDTPLARVHAYQANSPYATALEKCIYNTQIGLAECSLDELPLIGQSAPAANLEEIMDRVLVSHDWMGANFRAFMEAKDPHGDFARLLQSVTAVVISYDIRPSFYWVATGAIYLDPSDLWLTPAERDTINEAPDFRAGFGNELQFLMPWRYIKNNDYASLYFDPAVRVNRSLDDIEPELASLLYHELAHANDFFPTSIHNTMTGPTLYDEFVRRNNQKQLISDQLTASYPLQSVEMTALAQVRFRGETATDIQKAYLPEDITGFFSTDIANDFYAYSTIREDAAMLFEEAMMSHRLGILRDVAVTNSPDNPSATTVIVDWGQRGRIAEQSLQARAALVLDAMLPGINGNQLLSSLPEPVPMSSGLSWLDNLVLGSSPAPLSQSKALSGADIQPPLRLSGDRHRERPYQQ